MIKTTKVPSASSRPISITLPEAMLEEVERASKTEHRTRSELIREALRHYLFRQHIPVVEVNTKDLAAIRRGEKEIERGEYVTLDELEHDLATQDRKKRAKKYRKVSA